MKTFALRALFACAAVAGAPAGAVVSTIPANNDLDLSVLASDATDGVVDFRTLVCNCGAAISLSHRNSSARASSAQAWGGMTLAQAQAQSYGQTGDFIPSDDNTDLYYIKTGNTRFYKLRSSGNVAGGITLEWEYLGEGSVAPPNSVFSVSDNYDLWAVFSDASTGSASAWNWAFGDGNTSTAQNPRHRYDTAGMRTVTLTASNLGGPDATPATSPVTVVLRPSTTVAVGASFDLDNNAVGEMQVLSASGACGAIQNKLRPQNGGGIATLSKDYRQVVVGDIAGQVFSTADNCIDADYLTAFLVRTNANAVYRAWIAGNDAGGIRMEFALLQSGTAPPISAWTSSSYDLIVQFMDTSTGGPNGWAWTFGDSAGSNAQNPRYRYDSAGTRNVCLVASNVGGAGSPSCSDITVSMVASTQIAAESAIDLNGDGNADLLATSAAGSCGGLANKLRPINSAGAVMLGMDYRNVTAANAAGQTYSLADFCVSVDYLDAFLLRTADAGIYRAWTAANDGTGVRLEFSQLIAGSDLIFIQGFEAP